MEAEYKFNYRYNPKSNRLQDYDYSNNGAYFITICCKDRQEYFWDVVNEDMVLNEMWSYLSEEIYGIPKHRKNVILDEFVIMPNHIHMILFLNNNDSNNHNMFHWNISTGRNIENKNMFHRNISTNSITFWKDYYSKISPNQWNLWNIIKLFKSFFTKNINQKQNKIFFAWQNNYYDRIIRNEDELKRIRKYIKNNPLKWKLEKDNEQWIFI